MIEDFKIKVFESVARLGSFTKAAEELGVSQPAVSQNISELERELGVILFDRGPGRAAISSQGEKFLPFAREILYWYTAAEQALTPGNEQAPAELDLGEGRKAEVWTSPDHIHINLKP